MDCDLAAFLNDVTPPFNKVLDDFQDVILMNFDVEEKDMDMNPRSVHFKLKGVDFDLLPATNMVKGHEGGMIV